MGSAQVSSTAVASPVPLTVAMPSTDRNSVGLLARAVTRTCPPTTLTSPVSLRSDSTR